MKRNMLWIALVVLAAPIVFRALWFYQGIYRPEKPIATPAYEEIEMPAPAITPQAYDQTETGIKKMNTKVLFDQSHANEYTLSEIDPLVNQLKKIGAKIETNYDYSQLGEQLKSSDAYVIISPTINHTRDEIKLLIDFVGRGGNLLVIADPTRGELDLSASYYDYSFSGLSSVDMANLVLEPFDISFKNDYVYNLVENESNFRNIICSKMAANSPITRGLKKVVFFSAHSLQTNQSILLQGDENTLSSTTDEGGNLVLGAASKNGRVLALGDVSFMTAPYNQVANNATLVSNIATFLGGEKRARTLADFPYVFSNQVVVLAKNEEPLKKEMLQDFARIQSNLKRLGLSSKIYKRPISGSDLLVIGTFGQYEKLEEYLEPFDLKFSSTITAADDREKSTPGSKVTPTMDDLLNSYPNENSDELPVKQITVPGFDQIESLDMGLILLDSSNSRSTLVLLADSDTQLTTLADFVAYGDLSGCAIQDNIAVCPLSSNGMSTNFSYPDYGYNDYFAPTSEEILEETPTPEAVG